MAVPIGCHYDGTPIMVGSPRIMRTRPTLCGCTYPDKFWPRFVVKNHEPCKQVWFKKTQFTVEALNCEGYGSPRRPSSRKRKGKTTFIHTRSRRRDIKETWNKVKAWKIKLKNSLRKCTQRYKLRVSVSSSWGESKKSLGTLHQTRRNGRGLS
jgi:hypothetical protein